MHEHGKSDSPVVPAMPPNKAAAAEAVEERGLAEGNTDGTTHPGRSAGHDAPSGLDRVREVARLTCALAFVPEAGAQCVSSARWDLRGGPPARAVPTAITARVRSVAVSRPGEWAADRRDASRRRGRGGAVVVLRARESRVHGEGRQRVSQ